MNKLISFDYAIKYLLKNKANYDIIEHFISDLIKTEGYPPVKIIALMDTESNKEDTLQKKSLADLIVQDEEGRKYIVEIERQTTKSFLHKACFNTSRLIVDHIGAGADYTKIIKVFHISILYFAVGSGPIHHGETIIKNVDSQEKLTLHITDPETKKSFDTTSIFPEYFFISVPLFNDQIKREIDQWLYVIKNEEILPKFTSSYMQKVAERLSILKMTPQERDEYYGYMTDLIRNKDQLQTAREEGEARGEARGKIEGKIEGEQKKAVEIAKNLLAQNVDINIISIATSLTKEEIEQLQRGGLND